MRIVKKQRASAFERIDNNITIHSRFGEGCAHCTIVKVPTTFIEAMNEVAQGYLSQTFLTVSTIAPPHDSNGFTTDSTPFLPHSFFFADPAYSCLSRFFFSISPPVAVNISLFSGSCNRRFGEGLIQ